MSATITREQVYNLFKGKADNGRKIYDFNRIFYRYVLKLLPKIIAKHLGFEYFGDKYNPDCSLKDFFSAKTDKPIRLLVGDVQIGKTNAICLYILEARIRGYLPSFMTSNCSELAEQFISCDVPAFNKGILKQAISKHLYSYLEEYSHENPELEAYVDQFDLDNVENRTVFEKCLYEMVKIRPFRYRRNREFEPTVCFNFKTWCKVPVFLIENRNLGWAVNLLNQISEIHHLEPAFLIDEFHGTMSNMNGCCTNPKRLVNGGFTINGITFIQYMMKLMRSNGIIIGISATHLRSYIHPIIADAIGAQRKIDSCSFYKRKGLVYRGKNSIDDKLAHFNRVSFGGLRKTIYPPTDSTELMNLLDLVKDIVTDEKTESEYQKMILINVFSVNYCQENLADDLMDYLENRINVLVCNQSLDKKSIGHSISKFSDDIPLIIIAGHKCKEGNRFKPNSHVAGKFAGITHYIYMPSNTCHVEGVTQHQRWMGWYPKDFPTTQIYSTEKGFDAITTSCNIIDKYNQEFDHKIGRESVSEMIIPNCKTIKLTPNSRESKRTDDTDIIITLPHIDTEDINIDNEIIFRTINDIVDVEAEELYEEETSSSIHPVTSQQYMVKLLAIENQSILHDIGPINVDSETIDSFKCKPSTREKVDKLFDDFGGEFETLAIFKEMSQLYNIHFMILTSLLAHIVKADHHLQEQLN